MSAANVVKLETVREDRYVSLVKQGRTLLKEQDDKNWELGELASQVGKEYGEDKLGQYAKDIDVKKNFLMDCRTTLKAWPQKSGRPDFWTARILNPHPGRSKIMKKYPNITAPEARALMKIYNDRKKVKEEAIREPTPVLDIPELGPCESKQDAATRSLYNCACYVVSTAAKAMKHLDQANLQDKHVMDAISDAAKAWQEILAKAVTAMEDQS